MATVACSCAFGSSPRIWGTHRPGAELRVDLQFISTYVGNSRTQAEPPTRTPVHPHIRGELTFPDRIVQHAVGSSPHTWGTHGSPPVHVSPLPVHPHIRGELISAVTSCEYSDGSSPHTWGTRGVDQHRPGLIRFIPTCVGNSPCHRPRRCKMLVHPHMRWELRMV